MDIQTNGCCSRPLVVLCLLTLSIAPSANAAPISGQGTWETTLQGRDLDGNLTTVEAYYDTALNITWLANANYAGTTMNWTTANAWAASLNFNGITGWRLPTTVDADGPDADTLPNDGCNETPIYYLGLDCGYNISVHSEMSHMFYVTLGDKADFDTSGNSPQPGWGLTNTGPFSNVQAFLYWSVTEYAPDTSYAWLFYFSNGYQYNSNKSDGYYTWAVHSGDVGASVVPIPAAAWLFGSGLVGLAGFGRRNRAVRRR
jgi:hypothetical protein